MIFDPRTKIVLLIISGILAVMLDGVLVLLLCLLFGLILMFSQSSSRRRLIWLIVFLLLATWATAYSQGLFYDQYPRTPLFTLIPETFPFIGSLTDGIVLYKEGVLYGLRQSLRFSLMITVGTFVVITTQPRDLLLGMIRLGVPFPIAFMVTTAIRYLPMLASDTQLVFRSQQLRGARHFQVNLVTMLKHMVGIIRPVLVHNIRRATKMSEAIESRSFSVNKFTQRTYLNKLHFRFQDWFLVCTLIVLTVLIVLLKLSYWAYSSGLFYVNWLKPFYTFAGEML